MLAGMGPELRMAVIGVGMMGRLHAATYSQYHRSKLVGVCDRNDAVARAVASRMGDVPWYTDYRECLETQDCDAVAIATPDHVHRDVTLLALEAGKHVLLEKPLATTLTDGVAIARAARESGKTVMINCGLRQKSAARRVKDALTAGELGKVKHISAVHHGNISLPTEVLRAYAAESSLATLLAHSVDLVRWWSDSEVEEIFALETRGMLTTMGIDTHDTVAAVGRLSTGATLSLEASWIYPRAHSGFGDVQFNVIGEEGVAKFDHLRESLSGTTAGGRAIHEEFEALDYGGRLSGWWFDSLHYFVDSVLDRKTPTPDAADALRTLRVLIAMDESIKRGASVGVEYDTEFGAT